MTNVAAKTWSLSPESDGRLYSYPEGHAGSAEVSHGSLFTLGGTFGTRGDYNLDNYTWNGHRHIHAIWQDYSLGKNGYGFVQTGNAGGSSLKDGGPSRSGKYWNAQQISTSVSQTSQRTLATSGLPTGNITSGFYCWKHMVPFQRSTGKTFRFSKLAGSPQRDTIINIHGPDWAAYSLDPSWPYLIDIYGNLPASLGTWHRMAGTLRYTADPLGLCENWTDGQQITWSNSYSGGPKTVLPLVQDGWEWGGTDCSWPNSVGNNDGLFMEEMQINSTDIYLDCTAARVEINQGNVIEIQLVNSWTASQIIIIGQLGQLVAGPATLKVYDETNAVIHTQSVEVA